MRENKYDKLLLASVTLLILSAIMLLISGYNIYFKKHTVPINAEASIVNGIAPKLRDSLSKVYSNTVSVMDDNLNIAAISSADLDTKTKMGELGKLREEIVSLLANKNNEADLKLAKVKIEELQQKVALLQNKYTGVETENKKLQLLINRLLNGQKNSAQTNNLTPVEKQKVLTSRVSNNKVAIAGGLNLFAVPGNNNNGQETSNAENAEKIVGTFTVKNLPAKGNGELMIVVLQPDGKVVKSSMWESGTFDSAEGKKIYSRKLYTETTKEETQLNFSITPDRFLKGDYTMQIWYNGTLLAKMVKALS
jgi:hypothetical protein